MKAFNYIVVGGGSAGAVVASRLTEDPDISVLLIEAGGAGTAPFLQVPNGIYFVKGSARYHWPMAIEPDPTREGRREMLTCGRGLGGGSSINGMVYVKGLRSDFETWQAIAGTEWNVEAVNHAYNKAETALTIRPPAPMHPVALKFLQSAHAIGLPENSTDLLRTGCGAMPCPSSAAHGIRQSTARGYLKPARNRRNLTTLTHSVVTRLLVENGRVRGVMYVKAGREHTAYTDGEVILCAGAINTPRLLMCSGIGPADHLRSVGVTPILDQPQIGEGLQDHPCVWVSARVKERTWNDDMGPVGMVRAGVQWLFSRTGPAASAMCHVTLFGSSESAEGIPNFQMSFMPAGYVVRDDGVAFIPTSSVSAAVSLCRPSGRGSVRLRSSRFDDAPIIQYRLLDSDQDILTLTAACRTARQIYASGPMRDIVVDEASPGKAVESDSEWKQYIQRHAMNMCHPVGTCGMGIDERAVVDSRLRLRGLEGLRVADASVMPAITSGNTNAPSIMIGERAAGFILDDRH